MRARWGRRALIAALLLLPLALGWLQLHSQAVPAAVRVPEPLDAHPCGAVSRHAAALLGGPRADCVPGLGGIAQLGRAGLRLQDPPPRLGSRHAALAADALVALDQAVRELHKTLFKAPEPTIQRIRGKRRLTSYRSPNVTRMRMVLMRNTIINFEPQVRSYAEAAVALFEAHAPAAGEAQVCEVGFGHGHSTLLWLAALRAALGNSSRFRITTWNLWGQVSTTGHQARLYLRRLVQDGAFGSGATWREVPGDSGATLREAPPEGCVLTHVDGAHKAPMPYLDTAAAAAGSRALLWDDMQLEDVAAGVLRAEAEGRVRICSCHEIAGPPDETILHAKVKVWCAGTPGPRAHDPVPYHEFYSGPSAQM